MEPCVSATGVSLVDDPPDPQILDLAWDQRLGSALGGGLFLHPKRGLSVAGGWEPGVTSAVTS